MRTTALVAMTRPYTKLRFRSLLSALTDQDWLLEILMVQSEFGVLIGASHLFVNTVEKAASPTLSSANTKNNINNVYRDTYSI